MTRPKASHAELAEASLAESRKHWNANTDDDRLVSQWLMQAAHVHSNLALAEAITRASQE